MVLGFSLLMSSSIVFAQGQQSGQPATGGGQQSTPNTPNTNINVQITNPFNCDGASDCTITALLTAIVNKILIPIGGVVAVLMFIWTGFLFVTSQGSETKVKSARTALLNTSIGTAVLLGAWVIAKLIETTINQLR